MREPKNQMLGTMEPPLMQLSVNTIFDSAPFVIGYVRNKQTSNRLNVTYKPRNKQ